jgi:hypothetical protein
LRISEGFDGAPLGWLAIVFFGSGSIVAAMIMLMPSAGSDQTSASMLLKLQTMPRIARGAFSFLPELLCVNWQC